MKKVINGKIYNTETAIKVDCYCSDYYCSDFNYYDETLYKTKKGNYFLFGSGNALSKYSCSVGNNGRGGFFGYHRSYGIGSDAMDGRIW